MAKKPPSYTSMTLKEMRKRGRYVEKVEYINPYRIIIERAKLRILKAKVLEFCHPEVTPPSNARRVLYAMANEIFELHGKGDKKDLFGFMDLLAIDSLEKIVAVQSTGPSGHSEHRKKILRNDYALRWAHHAKIELWSWRKLLKKKGGKLKIWQPRMEVMTLDMFIEFRKTDLKE